MRCLGGFVLAAGWCKQRCIACICCHEVSGRLCPGCRLVQAALLPVTAQSGRCTLRLVGCRSRGRQCGMQRAISGGSTLDWRLQQQAAGQAELQRRQVLSQPEWQWGQLCSKCRVLPQWLLPEQHICKNA